MGYFLRRFFATVLMFVFIVVFLPISFIWGVYGTFFNENFYQTKLIDATYDFLLYQSQQYIKFQPIAGMDKQDFTSLLQTIISKDELKNEIKDVTDQVKDLKVDDSGFIELKIPLKLLNKKTKLFEEVVSTYLYEHLPKCTPEQTDYFAGFSCVPNDLAKEDFDNALIMALDRELLSNLPDEFVLKSKVPGQFQGKDLGLFFKDMSSKIFLITGLGLLLILALIALFIFRPLIRILKWEMKTIFFASLVVLLVTMVLNILVPVVFDKIISSVLQNNLVANSGTLLSVYILVMGAFTANLLKIIVPIGILSFGFWIIGMVFDRNKIENYERSGSYKGYQELH